MRSDLYSLGCTWYYLLLARPPFPEGTALQKLLRHGSEKPEDPRYLRSDLSSDLVAILYKLMAKRPSDRYQQPMELVGDLQLLAQLEDLPKSQMMGTMMVPPTVTQRTFTEMAMPWFLALAMLLLSTYWLQSMDRWQGNYPLPMSTADRSGMPPLEETNGNEQPRTDPNPMPTQRYPPQAWRLGEPRNPLRGSTVDAQPSLSQRCQTRSPQTGSVRQPHPACFDGAQ